MDRLQQIGFLPEYLPSDRSQPRLITVQIALNPNYLPSNRGQTKLFTVRSRSNQVAQMPPPYICTPTLRNPLLRMSLLGLSLGHGESGQGACRERSYHETNGRLRRRLGGGDDEYTHGLELEGNSASKRSESQTMLETK